MIEILLGPADVAMTRFAYSPLEEVIHSVRVLAGTHTGSLHRPWLKSVRPRLTGIDLGMLRALVRGPRFFPDFLAPPLERMSGRFDEEIEAIRETPAETVRESLDELLGDGPLPYELTALYDHPEQQLGILAGAMTAYWQAAIAPVWPRLRSVHNADIGHRMEQLSSGGLAQVFLHLHQQVEYADDRLRIDKPQHTRTRDAQGAGVLLVPCVFAWPRLFVLYNEPYQPSLAYPPRGIGQVWSGTRQGHDAAMASLLGRGRAALLAHLDMPLSTSQLAVYLGLTPPAVSQQLAILRRCRLVTSRRSGRSVLYQRTPLASQLLQAGELS
ncbi:DUF5937 family protein [Embleya sp. NBC_00896]|uniref:ArsR/SmtB family transcription factor n=1 Tax=Embleya sp. NBC_00896 TaxID=2975961 RepID=UPI003864EB6A|nr:DUF5937 family protein [Embleya sp. NBC_00896]